MGKRFGSGKQAWMALGPMALAAACGGGSSSQQLEGTDAGADADGGSLVLGRDGSADSGPSEANAPAPSIVYVSTVAGDNANDGLSPAHPKKTIADGILAATALGNLEVHVCKGVYVESALDLTSAVTIQGGYDCVQWTRTATYGYPAFDKVNETVIQNANVLGQAATLLVSGNVPATVIVDGFTVEGAPLSTVATVGIAVESEASPTISNCDVTGGAGTQTDGSATAQPASVGILLSGSGNPEVTLDRVSGGTGTGTTNGYGSTGVLLNGTGKPNLHDSLVMGGVAAAGYTAGIWSAVTTTMVAGNPLKGLTVMGVDKGQSVAANEAAIVVTGSASADIVGSDVYGNDATGATGAPTATIYGVKFDAPGALYLGGDRIFGGYGSSAITYAVWAAQGLAFEMDNCMIHAGEAFRSYGAAPSAQINTLAFDTFYAASANGCGVSASAHVTVQSGLFVGDGKSTALCANVCTETSTPTTPPPPSFDVVSNTVVGGFAWTDFCGDGTFDQTLSDPNSNTFSNLGAATTTADTVLTTTQCGSLCPSTLFGSGWTSDDGVGALFSTTQADAGTPHKGWAFAPTPPCAIATGGSAVTGVTTDIDGRPRSAQTPSVGATEVVGSCL
jgi:hypothetical protein